MKTALTGIKPTGIPHLGNYLGAILPALKLSETYNTLYFIADYHAFTSLRDPIALKCHVYDVAATWLAAGLDPQKTVFYRQSSIIETFELAWVLSCLLATGQLERGHAYKEALAQGQAPNAGIFNYPVLMAADILLFDTHIVPVGHDQKQHLELARDVALRFNHTFGENVLVVPEPLVHDSVLIPGTDGRKMSKSYGNVIPLFDSAKELKNAVMKIKTGSEPLEAPKDPENNPVFEIYKAVASLDQTTKMADLLRQGGYGWGHAKLELYDVLEHRLAPLRDRFHELRRNENKLDNLLQSGAAQAQRIAQATMTRVRKAIGIN